VIQQLTFDKVERLFECIMGRVTRVECENSDSDSGQDTLVPVDLVHCVEEGLEGLDSVFQLQSYL
jgi:hypothetical protein